MSYPCIMLAAITLAMGIIAAGFLYVLIKAENRINWFWKLISIGIFQYFIVTAMGCFVDPTFQFQNLPEWFETLFTYSIRIGAVSFCVYMFGLLFKSK